MTRYDTELGREFLQKKERENKPEVTHGTIGLLLIVTTEGLFQWFIKL